MGNIVLDRADSKSILCALILRGVLHLDEGLCGMVEAKFNDKVEENVVSKEGRIGTESCEICSKRSLVVVVLYVVLHETIEFWKFDALWKVVIARGEEFNSERTINVRNSWHNDKRPCNVRNSTAELGFGCKVKASMMMIWYVALVRRHYGIFFEYLGEILFRVMDGLGGPCPKTLTQDKVDHQC
ncbi:hypothetical protein DKX38_008053 [Salix brachista]|uniref:Uncharacterized protein n=1 Tax=Salix brachista TaxID=2182728 RepID=A0A5N5MPW7_9ROSI|nr:hypothetical protein DKX38_008053 [Salix brachista]